MQALDLEAMGKGDANVMRLLSLRLRAGAHKQDKSKAALNG